MAEIYVPNLMSFENDNTFLGSFRRVRFKLTPDLKEMDIRAEYWFGPNCYEFSRMDGEERFPLSVEGIEAMTAFLTELGGSETVREEAL